MRYSDWAVNLEQRAVKQDELPDPLGTLRLGASHEVVRCSGGWILCWGCLDTDHCGPPIHPSITMREIEMSGNTLFCFKKMSQLEKWMFHTQNTGNFSLQSSILLFIYFCTQFCVWLFHRLNCWNERFCFSAKQFLKFTVLLLSLNVLSLDIFRFSDKSTTEMDCLVSPIDWGWGG